MKMNVAVEDGKACCGCGACSYVCSKRAITMRYDDEGFLYPVVEKDLCISCGCCINVCAYRTNIEMPKRGVSKVFGVKHCDSSIRAKSRSGGVFVAISDVVLEKGGIVYGAVLETPYHVKHIRATDRASRDLMCGSKYVESDINNILPLIESDLSTGKTVLFSGTPCQSEAIARLFRKKYANLILCDFICHGVPSQKLWSDYLKWAKRKYNDEVSAVDFRDKSMHSWSSHVEKIILSKRVVYSRRYANLFYANQCLRPSCYICPYATPIRSSDFSLGDFWGIGNVNPSFNDEKGVSLLMLRTKVAEELFLEIKDTLETFETTMDRIKHYNLKRPTSRPIDREAFWTDYRKHGFGYVSRKYGGYDFLRKIKMKLVDHID